MSPKLQTALANLNGEQAFLNARVEAIERFYGVKLEFVDGRWRIVEGPNRSVMIGGSMTGGLIITGDINPQ
jgi:hypothetical protein